MFVSLRVRPTIGTFFVSLVLAFVCCASSAQTLPLADRLQSVRPNLFLSEDLNQRGLTATREACVRPCDQVWLISTRGVAGESLDDCGLKAIQLCEGAWQRSDVQSFRASHESDNQAQSIFYVHGNMTDLNWSIVRGLRVYQNLIGEAPDAPPVRFVIWSWPSERETIPIRDALLKARRAICVGHTLRAFLDSLKGDRPTIFGYSFGGQVIISALQSPYRDETLGKFHVTLIAPAFERDFIHHTMDGCQIAANVAEMDVYVNAEDRVIKANSCLCRRKYRRSKRCDHLLSSKLDSCCGFFNEIDVTGIQTKHSIILYSQQPPIVAGFREQVQKAITSWGDSIAPSISPSTSLPLTAETEVILSSE